MNSKEPNHSHSLLIRAHDLYKKGKNVDAEQMLAAIIEKNPDCADAYQILALISWDRHDREKAIDLMRRASRIDPLQARYHYNIGTMLQEIGKIEEAIVCLREAVRLDPGYLAALNNLSALLLYTGQSSESEKFSRAVLEKKHDYHEAGSNLGNALREQGRIDESIAVFGQVLSCKPDYIDARTNYLLTLNYADKISRDEILSEHKKWGNLYAVSGEKAESGRVRQIGSTLRIGYVSADFRDHAVARFFEPILANHDRSRIEAVCYYNGAVVDNVTRRLMSCASLWRQICGIDDRQVRRMIHEDAIDILVDLSGHTSGNRLRLFAGRCAPVQVTYLGYPNTTGINCMDFRITDNWADPPDNDRFYTEKQYRLPGGFLCYQPFGNAPDTNNAPAREKGFITFGSFNNLAKVNEQVVRLWSKVLLTVPSSRLVMKNRQLADSNTRSRYQALFASTGIDIGRIDLLPPLADEKDHLKAYHQVDIALDTFPYNGTTTTCEALWMGVPVVTLAGNCHAARVGVSILSRIGLSGCVAKSPEAYIGIASYLSSDPERLAHLRSGLRNTVWNSPLCNAPAFIKELEAAFFEITGKKN